MLNINNKKMQSTVGFGIYLLPILIIINSIFYHNSSISSIVLSLSFLVILILNLYALIKTKSVKIIHLIGILAIIIGFINSIINGSGFGSIITFSNLIALLIFFSVYHINEKQKKSIIIMMIISIIIVLFVFHEQNPINKLYYTMFPSITTAHINPNTVGELYFFLFVFLSLFINEFDSISNKLKKFIKFFIFCVILFFILKTQARTSLVATVVFFMLDIFNIISYKWSYKTLKLLYKLGLIFTLILTFIYILMYKYSDGNIYILGKNLFTGREDVWVEAYDILSKNWIFGYDSGHAFNGMFLSAHNSLLAIWFIFGIIPLICCMKCIVYSFQNVLKSKKAKISVCVLFACLVLMTFETVLSDSNIYYYFAMLFIVSDKEKMYDT